MADLLTQMLDWVSDVPQIDKLQWEPPNSYHHADGWRVKNFRRVGIHTVQY